MEGRLRIEGRVHGNVRAGGLELGKSGSIEGDLVAMEGATSDPFTIAGTVDGEVRAPRVEVGPTGSILKGIQAEEAHVRGSVEGGIIALRRLVLEETAKVEGDVRARTLALKEGGQVNGTIVMGEQAAREDTTPAAGAEEAGSESGAESSEGRLSEVGSSDAESESEESSDSDETLRTASA